MSSTSPDGLPDKRNDAPTTYAPRKELGMAKLLWHTIMSLDGFIAGPNDDMSWASGWTPDRVRLSRRSSRPPERF
jgi:hypothetical protein